MDNATLNAIVRPLSSPRYEVDIGLARLQQMLDNFSQDYGGLELEPDFQRGHVWLPAQQQHFIENVNYPPPGVTAEVGACEQQV